MTVTLARAPAPRTAAPLADAAVRVRGLEKRFAVRRGWLQSLRPREYRPALRGVSFEVGAGEIVGLLGPNGAGKTTLLKILSTLVTPDAGSAEVAGFDVARDPGRVRRALAPVTPDERSLEWRISARENLRFFGALHGLRGAALDARIDEVLATVELADAGGRMVAGFSSGMRQRLLIARGLLSRPRVLLLDEPTRSLDPIAARSFRSFLRREVVGGEGCSALLATHSADEALELCDRVAVLAEGRLLALGTRAELARAFGDERYRATARLEGIHVIRALRRRGLAVRARGEPSADGWTEVEVDVPGGGAADAAAALQALVGAGVSVARFEKAELTLAELIERVVEHRAGGSDA